MRLRGFIAIVREQMAQLAAVNRMAPRQAHSPHGEPRQFRPRHQLELTAGILKGDRAQSGQRAYEIAESTRKDHEETPCTRDFVPVLRHRDRV